MARRGKVVSTLTGGVAGLFKKNKIELIAGEATLTDGRHRARRRGRAEREDDRARDRLGPARASPESSSAGASSAPRRPGRSASCPRGSPCVGAGASGCEIASAYARLGSETHLFEVLDRVLPTEDEDISKIVGRGLSRQGIKVHTGTAIENVKSAKTSVSFTAAGEQIEVDWLVLAAGRGPDVAGPRPRGGRRQARRARADRRRRRPAHLARGHLRDRRPRRRPGARPQGLRRGDHRGRGRRRAGDPPARPHRHPARDLLHPERRQLRPDRGAGARGRPRRRRRQGALRRRRRRHDLRRPHAGSSRSSASAATASCSARTSSARARPS